MRKPRRPPVDSFTELLEKPDVIRRMTSADVVEWIRQANYQYLHWDKLRYRPRPEGITDEQGWAMVQLGRMGAMRALPISFTELGQSLRYWIPPRHAEWLHHIDQQAGGLIGGQSGFGVPDDDERYLYNSLMEEAIASSQLEGASTTRRVAKKMLREKHKPRDRAERMIFNNYRAILELRDLKKEKLTPELICHLQSVITEDTLDEGVKSGCFRENNEVCVVDTVTDEIIHQPPSHREIDERVAELCHLANTRSKDFVHPVIKAIAIHFALGFIHPFPDGNGRTARALFYWFMLKSGYWIFEFLPISRIFLNAPAKYARAYLYTETDSGDLTYFSHYHLAVIHRAIRELHDYLTRQQKELHDAAEIVDALPGLNQRQVSVIYDAIKHGTHTYTIAQHAGKYKVAKATARSDLFDLQDRGLFEKTQIGRQWVFHPASGLIRRLRKARAKADDDS